MARLAGRAGAARVSGGGVRSALMVGPGLMAIGRLAQACHLYVMGACSSFFNRYGSGRHIRGHHITRPAAQREQNDHQDKNKKAHEVMIVVVAKSSSHRQIGVDGGLLQK